jgi:transposase
VVAPVCRPTCSNRAALRAKRVKTVFPQPSDQIAHRKRRGSAGARPTGFDPVAYKGRNVIERSFNHHKHPRGLATRYDKLAAVYRGGVVLRAITIWLRE